LARGASTDRSVDKLRNSEIEQPNSVAAANSRIMDQHYIRRLEISMDDALLVSDAQDRGQLMEKRQCIEPQPIRRHLHGCVNAGM
jgi:hypothetical protein